MLSRYHKQKIDKQIVKQYKEISRKYALNYKFDSDLDFIQLSVFKTALKQKDKFEEIYEQTRNQYFDMWERLSFYERNEILHQELTPHLNTMKAFEFEETPIYIPFFDRLLNSLYASETAILELPQFFELYDNFNHRIIPLEFYGIEPIRHGFSSLEVIKTNETTLILYYPIKKIFYTVSKNRFKRYPIDEKCDLDSNQIETLANALLNEEAEFYDTLIMYQAIKKRCIKKILKLRRKGGQSNE